MRKIKLLFISAVILGVCSALPGMIFAADEVENTPASLAEGSSEPSEGEYKQQRWAVFPIIASSPEVGLMLGGMLFHFLPTEKPGQQASTIDLFAYGTTEQQYALTISPNLLLHNNEYRLNASLSANRWRANYYAIGNDSPDDSELYDSTNLGISLTAEKYFLKGFTFGIMGRFENMDMDLEPGGMLSSGGIHGAEDGHYTGVGLSLSYDTRDNTNAPFKGALAKYTYIIYPESLGSSLEFSGHTLDIRYYIKTPFLRDSVLAFAMTMKSTSGDVPFRYLPSPDGTLILRGIENGRYKDNQFASFQTEYRFPIHGRFSGTVFADFAQVADEFDEMTFDKTKYSIGTGFRYALNPGQRFNIRGDIAWVDGGIGFIINVREAF